MGNCNCLPKNKINKLVSITHNELKDFSFNGISCDTKVVSVYDGIPVELQFIIHRILII